MLDTNICAGVDGMSGPNHSIYIRAAFPLLRTVDFDEVILAEADKEDLVNLNQWLHGVGCTGRCDI